MQRPIVKVLQLRYALTKRAVVTSKSFDHSKHFVIEHQAIRDSFRRSQPLFDPEPEKDFMKASCLAPTSTVETFDERRSKENFL